MTKKRGNHEGSVHRLQNSHWRGQVSHEGHRLSKTFPTQRECIEWVRKNLNQINDGMSYTSTQLTINEYLAGWLTNAKTTKRYSTWIHYDWLTRGYINPNIGNIKLKDLRADHIQGLYNHLLKTGVGIHTIRKLHAVLHCALNQAVKQAVIMHNPASLVDPPRKPVREMVILTESQTSQLLVTAKNHRLEALFHLAITTGLRESELLGLKWGDLDWIKRTLKVERQLNRSQGDGVQFSAPKTAFGKRSIKLGSKSIEVLRKHYERQQGERIVAGDAWKENNLIFPTSIGTALHQYNLIWSFKLLLKQSGLPPIRFHDLRHTSASLMLNHDIPVIIVSRRLGHARASITSDVYGHLLPNMQDEAAEMIDDMVTPTEVKLEEPIKVV